MYKRTSRAMQHALRVDRIDPSRGMTGGIEPDYIPSADNMSASQCRQELAQLSIEQARLSHELDIAKREGNRPEIARLGHQFQALGQRRTPIKHRLNTLKQDESHQILGDVIRDLCDEVTARRIFDECKRRVDEAWS